MEEEDADVFEITDFTTSTDWEVFISSIEEIFNEWRLSSEFYSTPLEKDDLMKYSFAERNESLRYGDVEFVFTHHYLSNGLVPGEGDVPNPDESAQPYAIQDLTSQNNDFCTKQHSLAQWYGLRSFVLVRPAHQKPITGETRLRLLLSSVAIAVNSTGCRHPVFVQVDRLDREIYYGVCEGGGMRVDFEMVQLKLVPQQCRYLAGLFNMFKSKVNCFDTVFPQIDVSAQFTYRLSAWPERYRETILPGFDRRNHRQFQGLPLGVQKEDPIEEIYLRTTWPKVPMYAINESLPHSILSPLGAPEWSLQLGVIRNPTCALVTCFRLYLKLCQRRETVSQVLIASESSDDAFDPQQQQEQAGRAFRRLAESGVSGGAASIAIGLGQTAAAAATARLATLGTAAMVTGPIEDTLVNQLLWYLFPDAVSGAPAADDTIGDEETADQLDALKLHIAEGLSRRFKAAPPNSLAHRLSVVMATVYHKFQRHHALGAVGQIWQEVCLELRYRWDRAIPLPTSAAPAPVTSTSTGVQEGPDLACCRLQQKLQMLNYCIQRRVAREARLRSAATGDPPTRSNSQPSLDKGAHKAGVEPSEDVEDEFFECAESLSGSEEEEEEATNQRSMSQDQSECATSGDSIQPTDQAESVATPPVSPSTVQSPPTGSGRQAICGDLRLLHHPTVPLYIPVTQEAGPMTEDMLEEQTLTLTQLGTGEGASALRARLQSAALLSDMQAFKAANPGCCLEDFVRWYSPRDFIEQPPGDDGTVRGELSARMQVAGNIWVETWNNARPQPARLQKRLLDETKEAERVLHYLESLSLGQVAQHLLPCLLLEVAATLHVGLSVWRGQVQGGLADDGASNTGESQPTDGSSSGGVTTGRATSPPQPQDWLALLESITETAGKITTRPAPLYPPSSSPGQHQHHQLPTEQNNYEDLLRRVSRLELLLSVANSARTKLGASPGDTAESNQSQQEQHLLSNASLLHHLISQEESVSVPGAGRGPVGRALQTLVRDTITARPPHLQQQEEEEEEAESLSASSPTASLVTSFPDPVCQEFILRAHLPRPHSTCSRAGPQRLYCRLGPDDCRFAGAFTSDTTFT